MVPYVWKLILYQVSVESRVLYTDEHGLLYGPGMAIDLLVHYVEEVGVHGGPVVLWRCMGEGALKCSLTLSPKDLHDSSMYPLGQFMWGHW